MLQQKIESSWELNLWTLSCPFYALSARPRPLPYNPYLILMSLYYFLALFQTKLPGRFLLSNFNSFFPVVFCFSLKYLPTLPTKREWIRLVLTAWYYTLCEVSSYHWIGILCQKRLNHAKPLRLKLLIGGFSFPYLSLSRRNMLEHKSQICTRQKKTNIILSMNK